MKNTLQAIPEIALDLVVGGTTPSIYDPQFRADVLAPCSAAAGAQAMLLEQRGEPVDSRKLLSACASAVEMRQAVKSAQEP